MGLLSMLTKAGIAKKAIDEGRKPENQRKLKGLVARARGRGSKRPAELGPRLRLVSDPISAGESL